MSDQYKPKGITPLPWKHHDDRATVTGTWENGTDVQILCMNSTSFCGMSDAALKSNARMHEETDANRRYLVHAANQYPKVIAELHRALAVIRCPQAFEIEDVCADIQAVLNKAKELEADADTGERK